MIKRLQTESTIIWQNVSRAFKGAVSNLLTLSASGSMVLNGQPILSAANVRTYCSVGSNLAGNITVTGVLPGDKIIGAVNVTTPGNVLSSFNPNIATANTIAQTAAVNLSAQTIVFTVVRP